MADSVTIKSRLTPLEKARLDAKRAELEVEERYRRQISGTPLKKKEEIEEEEVPEYKPPRKSASIAERIKHASDWTGETKHRVQSAIDYITEGQIVDLRDMKILQAGWPELFGMPPELDPSLSDFHNEDRVTKSFKFPDLEETRKMLLGKETVEEQVKKSDVPKDLKKNFEDAMRATGVDISRVWESLDAVKRGFKLTALDRDIIKAGWPQMVDSKGRVKEADWEQAVRIAMKGMNVSRKRVEEAVERVNTFKKLVELDQKILQSGWPQIYGVLGTKFHLGKTIDNAPYTLGGGGAGKAWREEKRRQIHGITDEKKKRTTDTKKATEAKKEEPGFPAYYEKETTKEEVKKKGYPTGFKIVREEGILFPEKDVLVFENEPALTAKQIKELTPEWILERDPPQIEPLYDPNADQLYEAVKFWLKGKQRYTKQQIEYAKKHPKEQIFPMPFLTKKQWEDVKERHPVYYSILQFLRTGKTVSDEDMKQFQAEADFMKKHKMPVKKVKFKEKFFDTFERYETGKRLTKDDQGILQFYDPKKFGYYGKKFKDPRKKDIEDVIPIGSKDEVGLAIKKSKVEYARLTEREKEILQSNFPKLFGIPGQKFKKPKDTFSDYAKRAMETTGRNLKEVLDAIDRAQSDRFVRTKDKEILQSGWPHIFGNLGEHFKKGGHQVIPEVLPPDTSWEGFKNDWFIDNWFPGELKKQQNRIKDHMERMGKMYDRRMKRFLILHFIMKPILMSPMSQQFETRNEFVARINKQVEFHIKNLQDVAKAEEWYKRMEALQAIRDSVSEKVDTVYLPKETIDYIKHGGPPPKTFEPNQQLQPFKIRDIDTHIDPEVPPADTLYDKYLKGWPDQYGENKIMIDSKAVRAIKVRLNF